MDRSVENIMNLSFQNIEEQGIDIKKLYKEELYLHSVSVAEIATKLGIALNLNFQELIDICMGGLLHDFGKVFIEDEILYKPAKLSNMEYYLIQGHPSRGYKELKKYNFNENVMHIVLNHHEKLSGEGYPIGKHELGFTTQIITVADIYDAVHSKRSYHAKRTIDDSLDIVKNEYGLSPIVVSALEELIKQELVA